MNEIDVGLKEKYRLFPVKVLHRTGVDPPDGTVTWKAPGISRYQTRDVTNGPAKLKKYTKRSNKKRPRRRAYGPF